MSTPVGSRFWYRNLSPEEKNAVDRLLSLYPNDHSILHMSILDGLNLNREDIDLLFKSGKYLPVRWWDILPEVSSPYPYSNMEMMDSSDNLKASERKLVALTEKLKKGFNRMSEKDINTFIGLLFDVDLASESEPGDKWYIAWDTAIRDPDMRFELDSYKFIDAFVQENGIANFIAENLVMMGNDPSVLSFATHLGLIDLLDAFLTKETILPVYANVQVLHPILDESGDEYVYEMNKVSKQLLQKMDLKPEWFEILSDNTLHQNLPPDHFWRKLLANSIHFKNDNLIYNILYTVSLHNQLTPDLQERVRTMMLKEGYTSNHLDQLLDEIQEDIKNSEQ